MTRAVSNDDFIKRAKGAHGERYDYSCSSYKDVKTKVSIICKEHGMFSQLPRDHWKGHGCKKCAAFVVKSKISKSLADFIQEAAIAHNGKYDYQEVIYTSNKNKIIIICPFHGKFQQTPNRHISKKQGCPECWFSQTRLSLEEFISRSAKVHNDKYDYSKSKYINNRTKIEIICPEHGSFWQEPGQHLLGCTCMDCSNQNKKITKMEFLDKAKKLHKDKYDYSLVEYDGYRQKIKIICPEHGQFSQLASNHLLGYGCAKCTHLISKNETAWLDTLNIPQERRNNFIRINNKLFNVDGIDYENKIIYEFYGDYWHGNPKVFDPDKLNINAGKTFRELYTDTMEREKILKQAGWTIITIWENDFQPG